MWPRLWYLFVTVFFVTMNVLLWRSEFGQKTVGSPVPPETVWRRMLQTSDHSKLEIRHRGQRVGSLDWRPSLIEAPPENDRAIPEGMVREISGYRIDVDQGNLYLKDLTYLGFTMDLTLTTNYDVQHFQMIFSVRFKSEPRFKFTIRGDTKQQQLTISPPLGETDGAAQQVIPFDDLRNPGRLLQRLGGPLVPATLAALGLPLSQIQTAPGSTALDWHALKGHRVPIGHAQIPVYRLQARLVDRYWVNVYVTEGGEIFRVDLPNEVTLFNEKLASL